VADNLPRLSVVIPAYNEASRIERTLQRVVEYLDARGESYEILVVSDGSDDGTGASASCLATLTLPRQLKSWRSWSHIWSRATRLR